MFLSKDGEETPLQAGDIAHLLVGYEQGRVKVRIVRDGFLLRWRNTGPESDLSGMGLEESFAGIMCPMEIERALLFLARGFGLLGAHRCEPHEDLKKDGWIAFCFT